ncbi:LamG domain-containing protein [Kitasatospora sp. NPDC049285]|uniref:LamG domain-containing protein n=1 Tax=Kitasatospora sp. NPDC049285 TaxID=3157096 RepID=UPI0034372CB1
MTADGGIPGPGGPPLNGPGYGAAPPGNFGGAPAYLPTVTSGSGAPDWAALADANEREYLRKRRLKIGGGVLAVVLVGGIVATAVALSGPKGTPDAKPVPSATAQPDGPAPSAPGTPSGPPSASPSASASGSAAASASASATDSAKPGKSPSGKPSAAPTLAGFALGGGSALGTSDGHKGPTLVLYGNSIGYAENQAAVVDTSRSFTVSALVRNNAPSGGRAAVTQGGDTYYSFYLGREDWASHNQWVFKVQTAAGAQDTTTVQAYGNGATTGSWTLLTGVYDAGTRKIQLYVDGAPQQTTAVSGIWQTTGGLQLGRVRYKSAWSDFWDGAIADVQVWDRALPPAAVAKLNTSGGTDAGTSAAKSWLLP